MGVLMSKVELGVDDVAYSDEDGGVTTYQVAKILEQKYQVMEVFYKAYHKKIAEEVQRKYAMMLKRYLKDGKTWGEQTELPMDDTRALFSDYLDRDEWQQITGRTIMAAAGKSIRKKNKSYTGPRPAFIDTGLYRRSFRAFLKR